MAPLSPQPQYSRDVSAAITRGSAGRIRNQTLVSKAVLDQAAVVALLVSAKVPVTAPVSRSAVVRENFAEICYIFDPKEPQTPTSRLYIRIAHFSDNDSSALTMMKDYLSSFEENINKSVQPTAKAYGDCSLQTLYNVFFTHSRHMINISCGNTRPGIQILNDIAAAFDTALTKADTKLESLVFPVPKLATTFPINAIQGTIFQVKLASVTDLDTATYFKTEQSNSILQVQPSTSEGVFELISWGSDSSKITIVVLHKQFLTVGKTDILVNVKSITSNAAPASA